jgi:hypothetical protein
VNKAWAVAVLLILISSFENFSYGHPVHATFAEAQWNSKNQSIEVSLRLRGVDLESAISDQIKGKVDLEKSKNIDQLIEGYLSKNFYVILPTGKNVYASYSDKEIGITNTWIFFSFKIGEKQEPHLCKIRNTIFFDDLDGQKNVIEYRVGDHKKILSFEGKTRQVSLEINKK